MFNIGDLILVKFPFSDLSSSKVRPAIIIGKYKDDFIIFAISSKESNGINKEIKDSDLIEGKILIKSFVKINKIVSIDKNIIHKKIASSNNNFLEKIRNLFIEKCFN